MRVSELPAATLATCKTRQEAVNCLPVSSSNPVTGDTVPEREKIETNGHGTQRLRELAAVRVTPKPKDLAEGEITDTLQLREPGEEGDEEEENLGKLISRLEGSLCKKVDALAKVREITVKQREETKAALKAAMIAVKKLNDAPYRKVPDPEPKKCPRCHCDCLLVTSTKGNAFLVTGPGKRGQFLLEGGRAVYVAKEKRKGHEYQMHRRVCFGPKARSTHAR
jgi:hypothetical protein